MSLSKSEADAALELIQESQIHSARLAGYHRAGSQLILWGGLWMVGYGVEFFDRSAVNWIWPVLSLLGFVASVVLARRQHGTSNWRIGVGVLALLLFVVALLVVFGSATPEQVAAVFGLVVSIVYVVLGLSLGTRFILIGALQAALTLVGYLVFADLFIAWMSIMGGGSLILAGFWLQKA